MIVEFRCIHIYTMSPTISNRSIDHRDYWIKMTLFEKSKKSSAHLLISSEIKRYYLILFKVPSRPPPFYYKLLLVTLIYHV
jgi:hypothetical protein